MTIQEFNQALQEQGSEIEQAFGKLQQTEVRGSIEDAQPDGGWTSWAP